MKLKSVYLFFIAALICMLFYELPWYNSWINAKMLCDNCTIYSQSQYISVEERMVARFGGSYSAFMAIAERIKASGFKNPVILLPPTNYIHAMKIEDNILIPEPAVFYYFTGIKTVAATSPGVEEANLVLLVKNKQLWMDLVTNKKTCDSFVSVFKHYITK